MTDTALLRVVLGLVLVIATILSCAWLARRSGLLARGSGGILRSVATLALGPRNQITVVQVEQTWLVVGVSANQMTLLHSLPAPPDTQPDANPDAATAAAAVHGASFAEKLAHVLKRPR